MYYSVLPIYRRAHARTHTHSPYRVRRSSRRRRSYLLLGFGCWFSAPLKRFPPSYPSGLWRQRGFWDFQLHSSGSEVFLIRKHQPETHTCWRIRVKMARGVASAVRLKRRCPTSRSVSGCRSRRWCCQDIPPTRCTPPSTDGLTSPARTETISGEHVEHPTPTHVCGDPSSAPRRREPLYFVLSRSSTVFSFLVIVC